MKKIQVLIVEDKLDEAAFIKDLLVSNDYEVASIAHSKEQALRILREQLIDIIIIDIYLDAQPNGLKLAEKIRKEGNLALPFIFICGSQDRDIFERAKVSCPNSFLLKPYNEIELLYAIELSIQNYYTEMLNKKDQNCLLFYVMRNFIRLDNIVQSSESTKMTHVYIN